MVKIQNVCMNVWNKIKKPRIFSTIASIFCWWMLGILNKQVGMSERIVITLLTYYSAQGIEENFHIVSNVYGKIKYRVLLAVLVCYIVFTEIGGFYLFDKEFWNWKLPAYVFYVLSCIWMIPIIFQIISLLIKIPKRICLYKNRTALKKIYLFILWIIAIIPGLIYLFAYNPCITAGDDVVIWDTIHKIGTGRLIDWIPPFYLILLSYLIKIVDSITFLAIVQIFLWAYVIVESIMVLAHVIDNKGIGLYYCFMVFNYCNIIQIITVWKDAIYVPALFWLSILFAGALLDRSKIQTLSWHVKFIISALLTAFMRQSGIYVVTVMLLILLVGLRKEKYVRSLSMFVFVCLLIIKGPVYSWLDIEPQPQLKYFAMANDICYVYYNGGSLSEDAESMVYEITGQKPEEYVFNAYNTNYNSNALKEYSVIDFCKIYIKTFVREPQLLLKGMLTRTSIGWSVDKTYGQVDMLSCYTGERLDEKGIYDFHYPQRKINILTIILSDMHEKITGNSLVFLVYWRTSLYLTISLIEISILMGKKIKWKYILPFLPMILNYLTLVVSSGWPDYRYYWPCACIGTFLSMYYFAITGNEEMNLKEQRGENNDLV